MEPCPHTRPAQMMTAAALELDPAPRYEALLVEPNAAHNQKLALAQALAKVRARACVCERVCVWGEDIASTAHCRHCWVTCRHWEGLAKVRACACVRVRACVRSCVHVCVRGRVRM